MRYTGELDSWDERKSFNDNATAKIIDGVVQKIVVTVVHEESINTLVADDPLIYAGEILYKWEKSDEGTWVMEHSIEKPIWDNYYDYSSNAYRLRIAAKFYEKDAVYFALKYKT